MLFPAGKLAVNHGARDHDLLHQTPCAKEVPSSVLPVAPESVLKISLLNTTCIGIMKEKKMSTKGTLSNTIKSDSWYILPRTGIHINYTGHVPFWKVWSKITSAVKHYLQNRSKRKTEKERPQDHSKNKKYMYMCTCMYHMCMYMCITKRVRNFVFKNTTTEGVATEREREYTYFVA